MYIKGNTTHILYLYMHVNAFAKLSVPYYEKPAPENQVFSINFLLIMMIIIYHSFAICMGKRIICISKSF